MEITGKRFGGIVKFKTQNNGHITSITEFASLTEELLGWGECKRTYTWQPKYNVWHGNHAHVQGNQLQVCLRGRVEYEFDDGIGNKLELFFNQGESLYLPTHNWYRLRSVLEETILLVHTDTNYEGRIHYLEGDEGYQAYCTWAQAHCTWAKEEP